MRSKEIKTLKPHFKRISTELNSLFNFTNYWSLAFGYASTGIETKLTQMKMANVNFNYDQSIRAFTIDIDVVIIT